MFKICYYKNAYVMVAALIEWRSHTYTCVCMHIDTFTHVVHIYTYHTHARTHTRLAGLPLGVFLSYGFQVVIRSVPRLSRILLTCPAKVHFRVLTCSITSVTLVFSLTQIFVFLSRYVMFNILLSIFVSAAARLFFAWVVSEHVSAPCIVAGSTHKL